MAPNELQLWSVVDALAPAAASPVIAFVDRQADDPMRTIAGIAFVNPRDTSDASMIDLDATPDFYGMAWSRIEATWDQQRIWAIADCVTEAPAWRLPIVTSEDGGRTWRHLVSVRKPYYMAELHDFRMDTEGHGVLVLRFRDDPRAPLTDVRAGYYTYRSPDWGRTWSAPGYQSDAVAHRIFVGGADPERISLATLVSVGAMSSGTVDTPR